MREATAGSWLIAFVALFIIMFAAYLIFAINYSKSFVVKNNLIDFIEKQGGMTTDTGVDISIGKDSKAIQLIDNYLQNTGYYANGKCPVGEQQGEYEGYQGGKRSNGLPALTNGNSYFCIRRRFVETLGQNRRRNADVENMTQCIGYDCTTYYELLVFYDISLPAIGLLSTFSIKGETINIHYDGYSSKWNVAR